MKLPKTAAPFSGSYITNKEPVSLKGFPKGSLYAFSGLFFLLTLLVMFQSEEPFSIAAVVAYISCLTLTILLVSIPPFASYFINYRRKLHQIEEAILLLSEKRDIVKEVNTREEPSYSAVTEIENPSLEILFSNDVPESLLVDEEKEEEEETLSVKTEPEIESEPVLEETETKPKAKTKTPEEIDRERGQMSLLDMFSSTEENVIEETVIVEPEKTPERESCPTIIQAYVLLDEGLDLYIRGDSPLWAEEGVKMAQLDVGKYELILDDLTEPAMITFWINDQKKSNDTALRVTPGSTHECYPEI